MATTKREKLFTEFPPVSTEQWEEVIKADLKGADYERKLVWKTPEGFNVRPYYRAENLAGLKFLGSEAGVFPYVRGTRAHNRWKIHQTVIAFHRTKVSAAHPNMRHQLRRPPSYEELIHSRGTKPMSCVKPVMPSHPVERRSAERIAAANFRSMCVVLTSTKVVKATENFKIIPIFVS